MNNTHEIIFTKLRVRNFLSIKDVEFDFTTHNGMNKIFGINKDVGKEYANNGAGKCVTAETEIEIEIINENIQKLFIEFINNSKG